MVRNGWEVGATSSRERAGTGFDEGWVGTYVSGGDGGGS
jgi:hypothetical protein